MRRHSFLVQVRPGEPSTLENLRTRERVVITDLTTVGEQIERWMSELGQDPIERTTEMPPDVNAGSGGGERP